MNSKNIKLIVSLFFIAFFIFSCSKPNRISMDELVEKKLKKQDLAYIVNNSGDTVPYTGIVYDSTSNGLSLLAEFKDGKPHGEVKYFYEDNGKIGEIVHYENGKKQGKYIIYYKNGQKEEVGSYLNDEKHGEFIEYYEDGTTKQITHYKEDKRNGLQIDYYENGEVDDSIRFKNDLIDGFYKSYYKNGNLEFSGNFSKDKKDGICKYYNEDGTLSSEREYKNGDYYMKCDCCGDRYLSSDGWGIGREYGFNVYAVAKKMEGGKYCSQKCAKECGLN